jgi:hypothetical protein
MPLSSGLRTGVLNPFRLRVADIMIKPMPRASDRIATHGYHVARDALPDAALVDYSIAVMPT